MESSIQSVKRDSILLGLLWRRRHTLIAIVTTVCIATYLLLFWLRPGVPREWILWVALLLGGLPLVTELLNKLVRLEFGSDLLAGISIVTAVLLNEPLAGALVVLMLSGGEALESYAVRRASSVLDTLARRMPSVAHRKADTGLVEVPLANVAINDLLVVLPHESCPVDGVVVDGHGAMDESYLTGEPYHVSKSIGSEVLSGAINGQAALTIQALRLPVDSRYARIMEVMLQSQQTRPHIRRLGDSLGAIYTPVALLVAGVAWAWSGEALRFLSVLVIATPCPLLIAIPVAIIGSISLCAKRSVIVRDPAILENLASCRTMIFDKTGTLTYGKPTLVEQHVTPGRDAKQLLTMVSSLEQYSKHPLSSAIIAAAKQAGLETLNVERISERPGEGLVGTVHGVQVSVTSSKKLLLEQPSLAAQLPPPASGLECVILVNGNYAATYRFRDEPRRESASFVEHLLPKHGVDKVMLVSGDRLSEVEYLAQRVGITEVHASKSPEEKLEIVRRESAKAKTCYVGDGINDAPAMLAATVGIAMGQENEITSQAAGAVIMNSRLGRVDELLHIGKRMRRIALQSAVGGMAVSLLGMFAAAAGYLPPVAGAVLQEVIDVVAVLNALRAAWPPGMISDYESV
jgi:heavy metal translocating P-type ATPase